MGIQGLYGEHRMVTAPMSGSIGVQGRSGYKVEKRRDS